MSNVYLTPPPTVVILGIPFHNVTFQEAVEWTRARILSRRPGYIATVNIDFVMKAWRDPELQRILLEADLVVADGIPIVWLSGFLGPRLKMRVTGSDLVPMFAEMARASGFSIFNLGGAPGVAEKAAGVLTERYPGLRIAGCYSPPMADVLNMNHADILARIEAANPDLLLVAFGAPKQEKWVNLHVHRWNVPLAIGVGGSLDFLAGTQQRAPRMVQRLALEWLWRMCSDPPRLVNRYLRNITFFLHALVDLTHIRLGPDRAQPPVGDNPALRRMALVEPFVRLTEPAQVEAFCAAILDKAAGRPAVPAWVIAGHLLFLAWMVLCCHYPVMIFGGVLFFLAFYEVTREFQNPLDLRAPVLVGFFLAGLVIHGGLQQWWIEPVLGRLGELPLLFGALGLTAFNDNAAVTYLATLVPSLTDGMKYAVVAGAMAGGGLTVIANAPNPAGQSILNRHFQDGIAPLKLFLGALFPTAVVAACLLAGWLLARHPG